MNSTNALKFIDKNKDSLLKDLQTLIHQPSISAKNEGIKECSILVSKILKKLNPSINIAGNSMPPRSGAFEVSINNQIVFSKFSTGCFPKEEDIRTWLK